MSTFMSDNDIERLYGSVKDLRVKLQEVAEDVASLKASMATRDKVYATFLAIATAIAGYLGLS